MAEFQRKWGRGHLAEVGKAASVNFPACSAVVSAKTDKTESGTFGTEVAIDLSEKMLVEYGHHMFSQVYALAREGNCAHPPRLDDLTVRAINRCGGWVSICKQWTSQSYDSLERAFDEIICDLIPHKLTGYYDHDKMPANLGLQRRGEVYRLQTCHVLAALRPEKTGQGRAG